MRRATGWPWTTWLWRAARLLLQAESATLGLLIHDVIGESAQVVRAATPVPRRLMEPLPGRHVVSAPGVGRIRYENEPNPFLFRYEVKTSHPCLMSSMFVYTRAKPGNASGRMDSIVRAGGLLRRACDPCAADSLPSWRAC